MRQGSAFLLLLGLLLLALAGCNPADDSGGGTSGGGNTGGGTSGAGGGGEEGPVKIGFNFEETGPIASFGTSSHSGALMAVDEINAAGGILGRQIEAIWDDNASKTDEAAKVAEGNGWGFRVVRVDGVDQAVTADYVPTRVNVEVTAGVVTAIVSIG